MTATCRALTAALPSKPSSRAAQASARRPSRSSTSGNAASRARTLAARAANSVRSRARRTGPAARAGAAPSGVALDKSVEPLRRAAIARQPEYRLRGLGGESEDAERSVRQAERGFLHGEPRAETLHVGAARRARQHDAARLCRERRFEIAPSLRIVERGEPDIQRGRRRPRRQSGNGGVEHDGVGAAGEAFPDRRRVVGGNEQQRPHSITPQSLRRGACA